ncbi:hypothetical protein LZ30DRAFT_477445 [Colletotrichum cereale]|nr:hypothetical protein LZ30DRAFT_477445 [Colletotrichum cereale]
MREGKQGLASWCGEDACFRVLRVFMCFVFFAYNGNTPTSCTTYTTYLGRYWISEYFVPRKVVISCISVSVCILLSGLVRRRGIAAWKSSTSISRRIRLLALHIYNLLSRCSLRSCRQTDLSEPCRLFSLRTKPFTGTIPVARRSPLRSCGSQCSLPTQAVISEERDEYR